MNLQDRLYTSTEVAEILGVSLRSIYRYLEEGKLDAEVKTATGRHRFSKQDITNFLYPDKNAQEKVITYGSVETQVTTPTNRPLSQATDVQNSDVILGNNVGVGGFGNVSSSVFGSQDPFVNTNNVSTQPINRPVNVVPDQTREFGLDARTMHQVGVTDSFQTSPVNVVPEPVMTTPVAPVYSEPVRQPEAPVEEQPQESAIDWLKKFKESAKSFGVDEEPNSRENIFGIGGTKPVTQEAPAFVEPKSSTIREFCYYRSSIDGLIDIAQTVDRISKKKSIPYMFTMSAGLSLHKPLKKHFSLLHVYVKPEHRKLFEEELDLSPTTELNAQLCLIISNEEDKYAAAVSVHGLSVVSNAHLREDLLEIGDDATVNEMNSMF